VPITAVELSDNIRVITVYKTQYSIQKIAENKKEYKKRMTQLERVAKACLAKAASDLDVEWWGPPSDTMFLGSPRVSTTTRISIGSAVVARPARMRQTDWQTPTLRDHHNSPHFMYATRCGLVTVKHIKHTATIRRPVQKVTAAETLQLW